MGANGDGSDRPGNASLVQAKSAHQGVREDMGAVAMWENRHGTMICDESSFNGEATRTPHPPRRWSFVVDAAVGPLSVTAQLGFRRKKRNLIVAGTPAQELVSPS
jgi:hypothetical protein